MTEFSNRQIPPPANWPDFEGLCCDLWTEMLGDPNTALYGRSGQAQQGVDVYGRNKSKNWVGVQCKGKDGLYRCFSSELSPDV